MRNTLRALDFFASLHLTIFERAVNFEFFNNQREPMTRPNKKPLTKEGFFVGGKEQAREPAPTHPSCRACNDVYSQ